MNEQLHKPPARFPTRGAEGLPRWRWTLAEFDKLIEVGLLGEDDRVELIEGEIVPMAAKGNRHDHIKDVLAEFLQDHRPGGVRISVESGWSPIASVYYEPDLRVYPKQLQPRAVAAAAILLMIEIADSSLAFDLGSKAGIYAGLGVEEYWVVDAWSLVTHVHREPSAGRYARVTQVQPGELLAPSRLTGLDLRMSDLQLE